jgi:hypothetical protein
LIPVFGYAALKIGTQWFYISRRVIDQGIWNGIQELSNITVNFSWFMYFILKHGEGIFWIVVFCSLVDSYQCFRETSSIAMLVTSYKTTQHHTPEEWSKFSPL